MPAWTFNGKYEDYSQVAAYLPRFREVLAELTARGEYRYNSSFKGRIAGIEGPGEDTAIYMLQGLEHKEAQDAKVETLLAADHAWLDSAEGTTKFKHVVLVPMSRMGGAWAEFRDARVIARNGEPHAVLPKGKRTHGHLILGRRVLVAE